MKKIHKGDIIEYESHISMVYSDRPSNCVDNDGKTTCTYEIIHAYGVPSYFDKTLNKPVFSRKVIKQVTNFHLLEVEYYNPQALAELSFGIRR